LNLQRKDIDALFEDSIEWACTHRLGALYGSSSDGGGIALRIRGTLFEGNDYLTIVITKVCIPEARQGQGLYRKFLSELDSLGTLGLRCHSMTENEWLADRHRRHGYKEVDESGTPSFYQVIGEPLPPLPDTPSENRRPELEKQREYKLKTRVIRRQLGQPPVIPPDREGAMGSLGYIPLTLTPFSSS
tara:strand:+ start:1529 stop:2092 length:564 start_codon:yes stop_codon:yes gene_type:complete